MFKSGRRRRVSIGLPTDFRHPIHVGFDPDTGQFTGLPKVGD